jgi:hypothetical protein
MDNKDFVEVTMWHLFYSNFEKGFNSSPRMFVFRFSHNPNFLGYNPFLFDIANRLIRIPDYIRTAHATLASWRMQQSNSELFSLSSAMS